MYRYLLIYLFGLLLLQGCTSPLEKSVLEPLTSKELDKVAGEDNSFLATYSIVEEKWNYMNSPQDSARWQAVTYGRLHSYLKSTQSAGLNSPLFSRLRDEWEQINSSGNAAADSLIQEYENFIRSNSPDSLVSVSCEGVEFERIRNIKKEIDTLVKVKLKARTLKGRIDSVKLSYAFIYSNASDTLTSDTTLQPVQSNYLEIDKRITDSISLKVFPALTRDIKRRLVSNDSAVTFEYTLHSVYSQGKCHNMDSLRMEVPEQILSYIDASSAAAPLFDSSPYRERIIRELVNREYVSQSAYLRINAQEYYRQMDSLVFNFLNYNGAW